MTNGALIAKLARVIESCQTRTQLKAANRYAWLMLDKIYPVRDFWGTSWGTNWDGRISFARMIEGAIRSKAKTLP